MLATPVIAKSAPKLEKGGSGVAGMRPAALLGAEHPQGLGARWSSSGHVSPGCCRGAVRDTRGRRL